MPPTIPNPAGQLMQQIAAGLNGVRAQASQQQNDYATASGQVVYRTGNLFQYPQSGSNYTSGTGFEVLSAGSGSAPVIRGGIIIWQSSGGGLRTILGLVKMDSSGLVRVVFSMAGIVVYDTSGNQLGFVQYGGSGTNINF